MINNFIDEHIKEIIGFNYVLQQLTIHTPYGNSYIQNLIPLNKEQLLSEFKLMQQFIHHIDQFSKIESILDQFKDITTTLKNCEDGNILDIIDLYEIKIQAISMNELTDAFNHLNIGVLTIKNCQDIISLLSDDSNLSNDFTVYNSYSNDLKQIRLEKRKIEHHFFQANEEEREKLQILRSNYVMLEAKEELKVRSKLSQQLKKMIHKMQDNVKRISHIDVLIGKAKLAVKYSAVMPSLTNNEISLVDMKNPFVKYQVEQIGNNYTLNSINLNQGITLLTGANMSGKSSIIKTVALNVYLAQLGFFVFAKSAEIPIVLGIEYIGYETKNKMHGLSSFGHEINSINKAIKKMKLGTHLICIDEFARSTNPSEGQKFVKAFALFAQTFSTYSLLATHYDGIATHHMNHYQIAGLKEEEMDLNAVYSISDFNRFMNYSLKKVTNNEMVPKEAYKVSILLDVDKDYKAYLDKCYKE